MVWVITCIATPHANNLSPNLDRIVWVITCNATPHTYNLSSCEVPMQTFPNPSSTSATESARADEVKNRSGGFVFQIDKWKRLDRFLITGTSGGTYYVTEHKLSLEAARAVLECLAEDGPRTVARIVHISESGRAPKNDQALYALALAARYGSAEAAYASLPNVARIGTHLFMFCEYAKALTIKGGSGYKRALGRWYAGKSANDLAYQVVKYRQREGWTHRDVLRLSHLNPTRLGSEMKEVLSYAARGTPVQGVGIIQAYERAKVATGRELPQVIREHKLPWECVPTDALNRPEVWEALLEHMPMMAVIRNLTKISSVMNLTNTSSETERIVSKLTDQDKIVKARIHPIAILTAMRQATVCGRIMQGLNDAFYLAYKSVRPTGKRICLALDVSGSMDYKVSGSRTLRCRDVSVAAAMVTAATEARYELVAFSDGLTSLNLTAGCRLDDAIKHTSSLEFSWTNISLPMLWALRNRIEIDAFVIYTDNENNTGEIHPWQALEMYRHKMGIPAKLISVAMSGDRFSVADQTDIGQLDVIGFDTNTPAVISDFIADG